MQNWWEHQGLIIQQLAQAGRHPERKPLRSFFIQNRQQPLASDHQQDEYRRIVRCKGAKVNAAWQPDGQITIVQP